MRTVFLKISNLVNTGKSVSIVGKLAPEPATLMAQIAAVIGGALRNLFYGTKSAVCIDGGPLIHNPVNSHKSAPRLNKSLGFSSDATYAHCSR